MFQQIVRTTPFLTFILASCVILGGCESNKSKDEQQASAPTAAIFVPDFEADSAYSYIEKQVAFGPRVPNTKNHQLAGDYIVSKLKEFNWNITEQHFESQTFDGQLLYLRNIIASYQPNAKKRILLAAHWDSRPFADHDNERQTEPIDGANDGASGVGVLLEVARVVNRYDSIDIGVDIILFDGEDWGETAGNYTTLPAELESWWCLGSQYWAKNKHLPNYSAYYGILLDMVGGENAQFYIEGHSQHYAPSIVQKVWTEAHRLGYSRFFIQQNGGTITDDHYFVNKNGKIPMVDIIPMDPMDGSFGYFHHTHDDNMQIISKTTLKAVGETVLHLLYKE